MAVLATPPVLRSGLVAWLSDNPRLRVARAGDSGERLEELVHSRRVTVVVITDDHDVHAVLGAHEPSASLPAVMVVTDDATPAREAALIRVGVAAVLPLASLTQTLLLRAVEDVVAGRRVLSAAAVARLTGGHRPLDELSRRQREVAFLLMQGRSIRSIAERLRLSESTVKTHVARLMRHLGVAGRAPLAEELTQLSQDIASLRVIDHTPETRTTFVRDSLRHETSDA